MKTERERIAAERENQIDFDEKPSAARAIIQTEEGEHIIFLRATFLDKLIPCTYCYNWHDFEGNDLEISSDKILDIPSNPAIDESAIMQAIDRAEFAYRQWGIEIFR